ncbi:hypothetical protein [Streptomyces virginiae]|uniref:hypothetical protein n=1 Tax=Streptomyces virginiae TaxID=1961 RepID=UPI0017804ED3|nr:hypothetical protein [Streptomyces virginiae]MBP2341994.1 hypothetical protein [Streptomyces virginiae]
MKNQEAIAAVACCTGPSVRARLFLRWDTNAFATAELCAGKVDGKQAESVLDTQGRVSVGEPHQCDHWGRGSADGDKDVRAGLGLALEAATTGRPPGSRGEELGCHSEAQAHIMHDTINLLDYGDAEGKEGKADRTGNDAAQREARQSYTSRRESADDALRERK